VAAFHASPGVITAISAGAERVGVVALSLLDVCSESITPQVLSTEKAREGSFASLTQEP
jgi:hypothetical protein